MTFNKIAFLTVFLLITFWVFSFTFGFAEAALVNCGNSVVASDSSSGCKLGDLFTTAFNLVQYMLSGAAAIAVGGVIYGGVLMVTSAGNEGRSTSGKKAVTNSLIGLAVILLAYLLVRSLFLVLGFGETDQLLNQPDQYIQSGKGLIN